MQSDVERGCQKKIAEKIIEKEADYVLMVKDNQKTLRKQIEQTFERKLDFEIDVTRDFGHGRIEKRIQSDVAEPLLAHLLREG